MHLKKTVYLIRKYCMLVYDNCSYEDSVYFNTIKRNNATYYLFIGISANLIYSISILFSSSYWLI